MKRYCCPSQVSCLPCPAIWCWRRRTILIDPSQSWCLQRQVDRVTPWRAWWRSRCPRPLPAGADRKHGRRRRLAWCRNSGAGGPRWLPVAALPYRVATFAALYPNLTYKPIEDFSSVGLITEVPMTVVGRKDFEPKTFTDLLSYVKANGPAVTFGTAGTGAVSDLCGRLLQDALGTKITLVPYKGMGPAMTDLIGGRIDLACDQTTNTTTQIKAGEVHPYAVTTKARIGVLPDLPTIEESGLQGFELSAWHALWAPKETPEAIRSKLAEALRAALRIRP